jgi:hypothetical protein
MIGVEEDTMETAIAPFSGERLAQLLTNKGASSDEAEFVRKHNITCNTIDDLSSIDLSHGLSVDTPSASETPRTTRTRRAHPPLSAYLCRLQSAASALSAPRG